VSLARPPGWEADSYGYHGDDGQIYNGANQGKQYGPVFTTGDTIGCGLNFRTGTIFFTRNGVDLGKITLEFRLCRGLLTHLFVRYRLQGRQRKVLPRGWDEAEWRTCPGEFWADTVPV
jgi:hypothetical protein